MKELLPFVMSGGAIVSGTISSIRAQRAKLREEQEERNKDYARRAAEIREMAERHLPLPPRPRKITGRIPPSKFACEEWLPGRICPGESCRLCDVAPNPHTPKGTDHPDRIMALRAALEDRRAVVVEDWENNTSHYVEELRRNGQLSSSEVLDSLDDPVHISRQ
jgi:hypothetical protein